jgi:succinate dehydrogenase / fumarate reductase cytochrome b subunit
MRSTRVPDNAPGDIASTFEGAALTGRARSVFSLSGVFPLGAFFVAHVVTNARAVRGDAAFVGATRVYQSVPALPLLEVLFVFAPLAFHGAMGLWLTVTRRRLEPPVPYPPGLRVAMRATGVLTLAFLAMHLPELRFRQPGTRPDGGVLLTVLASNLSSTWHGVPWRGIAYLVAAGCASFHFAAGLWGCFVVSRARAAPAAAHGVRADRGAAWAAGAIGAVLWLLLANVVVLHATGSRLFGAPARDAAGIDPCPAGPPAPAP